MKKLLLLIPIIAVLTSCNCKKIAGTESTSKQALYEVLSESAYQGKEQESFEVIKNDTSLKALYQSINNENVPTIDFKKERVVALFLGQRNTGGYAIKIKTVTEKDNKIYVEVEKQDPKSGGFATMAITNPYYIAKINSVKEIIFK